MERPSPLRFLWSVKKGQYDDEMSPPMRMLYDNAITGKPIMTNSVMNVQGSDTHRVPRTTGAAMENESPPNK